jgi:hypothetical protein
MSLVFLVGMVGCASQEAAIQPVSGSSSVPAAAEANPETTPKAFSDSLESCLARIQAGSSEGTKTVAEQSCQDNEGLRQAVAGTAITKSGDRASSGTQGDSIEACMARIPQDATEGQRMLAEDSCQRDQSLRR